MFYGKYNTESTEKRKDAAIIRRRKRDIKLGKDAKFEFTSIEKRIVQYFDGNVRTTAIALNLSPTIVKKALGHTEVVQAIRDRGEPDINKKIQEKIAPKFLIAGRKERQQFWTELMHNEQANMTDRIKASELLGKSEGDFLERIEHTGQTQSIIQIMPIGFNPTGLLSNNSIKVIEAKKEEDLPNLNKQETLSDIDDGK
jgi:hypothetical protein